METEENLCEENITDSFQIATEVIDNIIEKGGDIMYDKYLQSILPNHEINTVLGSIRHVVRGTFVARDFGEIWNDEIDTEPTPPIVCAWANGGIPVETKVVFNHMVEDEKPDSIKKTVTKTITSYIRKKMKSGSILRRPFKEFKPKPKALEESDFLHPRLKEARSREKDLDNKIFPHLDLESQIEKLRKK